MTHQTIATGAMVALMLGHATPAARGGGTCGTFAPEVRYGVSGCFGNSPYSVAIGDLDGINGPDLAVASGNSVSVLLNNGDGTFAADVTYGAGERPNSVAIGDLDGVNGPDLAVTFSVHDEVPSSGGRRFSDV